MSMMTFTRRALLALAAASTLGMTAAVAEEKALDTSRLVSIGGAVTEIVYDLGLGDKLIARDSTSFFPEQAMKLPDVGYMRALSPEGVLSVNPSAILMIDGSGPKEALDVLSKAAVPIVNIPEGYDKAAILTKIGVVGKALGVEAKAGELAAKVGSDIDAATAAVADIPADKRKRVLFVLTVQNGKIMVAGQHTAADGIVRLAGAVNATGDFHGYKPLNDEAVIAAKPDYILLMSRHGPAPISDEEILGNPAIALTPAGKNRAVIRVNASTMLAFGPRTAEGIRELSKALYGG